MSMEDSDSRLQTVSLCGPADSKMSFRNLEILELLNNCKYGSGRTKCDPCSLD